ncbi:MAG: hypothetical protein ACOZDD_12740 [Bacteroidota bacterium]
MKYVPQICLLPKRRYPGIPVRVIPLFIQLLILTVAGNVSAGDTEGQAHHSVNRNISSGIVESGFTPLPGQEALAYHINAPQNSNQTSVFRRKRSMLRNQAMGIGANLLGPTMGYTSVFLQYSPGEVVQTEIGADLTTVYGGITLYPKIPGRIEGLSPYMGLMIGYSDPARKNIAKGIYAYMPVGLRYVTQDDWYVSIEMAATTASTVKTAPLFMGVKLGYLFKL